MATIPGTPQADTLPGTAGSDLIVGRRGADFISGREGDDIVLAGSGDDTVAGDNIPILAPGGRPGTGPYISFDFGPYPPEFGGTPGDNLIFAGAGDDSVLASFGADTVFGGGGNDTILGYGVSGVSPSGTGGLIAADGPDWLFGGGGDDSILGGGGDDLLSGDRGNDTLVGGRGVDTLIGDAGPDVFVFGRMLEPPHSTNPATDTGVGPGHRDVILDFCRGTDLLDFTRYRNIFTDPDIPDVLFLGTDPFEASFTLQIRYQIEDGRTVVQFYAPFGAPPPDAPPSVPEAPTGEIELVGVHNLTAGDFILS